MQKILGILCILSLLLLGCRAQPETTYTYSQPEKTGDGLDVGSLSDVGIDSSLIVRAIDRIYGGAYREIHSFLIFKDNKLVLDKYFDGHEYKWENPGHHGDLVTWNKNKLHDMMSVTKSVTAACIGIAIDQGFIKDVQQSIFDYLPDHQQLKKDGKEKITIEHLVTMTSGLEWDEWRTPLSSTKNDIVGLWFPPCEDQLSCILDRPLVSEPGERFIYSGGNTILLGEIIRHATGMGIDEFSQQFLFDPMEIDTAKWGLKFESGIFESAGGLFLTPRAMIKIGAAFLNGGMWNGKRVISADWVEKSSALYRNNQGINIPGQDSGKHGYAYGWWTKNYHKKDKIIHLFSAGGWGGQEILVFPDLNMVVVFTGGTYVSDVKAYQVLERFVLPAIYR